MLVEENLIRLKKHIDELKKRFHIAHDIKIVAVSKKKPLESISEAIEAGHSIFAENRIQEAMEKIPKINDSTIQWHFIGHLQRNKAKIAVELFDCIHSIDKYETALEVSKKCEVVHKTINIFLQVNTTAEEQKSGVEPEELEKLIEKILPLPHLKIIGLMTMGLFTENRDVIRKSFALLRSLRDKTILNYPDIKELSMGMSGDYDIAIEEGATYLRLGTSVFGKRNTS